MLNYIRKNKEVLSNTFKVHLANIDYDIKTQNFDDIILPNKIKKSFNSDIIEKRPDYLQQAYLHSKKISIKKN